ncbi:hypothetical protein JTB14_003391 [Gonioctena quinquepunctata]|nr:hypothetical protein JTB14_003391 [Gonioctena quinquepunctata]
MTSPVVNIAEGKLRGCTGKDLDGEQFYKFLGIPFAKPPLGELRFKAPQPIDPWDGIKDAVEIGSSCIQRDIVFTQEVEGSEDCLNLNVFTKTLPQEDSKLKPVMVWIHGGAFTLGSNSPKMQGPEYIMTEDVVMVSINYRLGYLGFLSLEDTSLEVPGNAGLKDQVLALKWVQKNIKHFNGDPNNVTIFGLSAGGASVHYLILSSSAKGLFHKAIMMSGVAVNPWASSERNVFTFLKSMGKDVQDEKTALDILMKMPIEELFQHQDTFFIQNNSPLRIVGPVIENPNPTAFITKPLLEIICSGEYNKVPIIIGYTSNEGLLFAAQKEIAKKNNIKIDDKPNMEDFIFPEMKVEKGCTASQQICKKIADFYFQGENAKNQFLLPTDFHFATGIIGSAKNHSETSNQPVYLYRVSLESKLNLFKKLFKIEALPGVCHGDDMGYLFTNTLVPDCKIGEAENIYLRRFLKLWTNFAKFGNPTPNGTDLKIQWRPVEKDNLKFLDIGKELTMHCDPEGKRMEFWKDIVKLSPATAKYL